jgi:uncharacterized protein YdhG (YjbR/CyaY superfamily)
MQPPKITFHTIDDYIATFPPNVQALLQKLRTTIKQVAPTAGETISYQMPTFTLGGKHLVYFAGFKNHIGFYPFPSGVAAFKEETKGYKTSKGTIQFPLDQPLPLDLIKKIVAYRVKERTGY